MNKHATLSITIGEDESTSLNKIMKIIYGNNGDCFIQRTYTDYYYGIGRIYTYITFTATIENIIRILQDEDIIRLLYR